MGTPGIVPLAPQIEGIENVIFNSFVMGSPITNFTQQIIPRPGTTTFRRSLGTHTLKVGFVGSYEQVNVNPNPKPMEVSLSPGGDGTTSRTFSIGVPS